MILDSLYAPDAWKFNVWLFEDGIKFSHIIKTFCVHPWVSSWKGVNCWIGKSKDKHIIDMHYVFYRNIMHWNWHLRDSFANRMLKSKMSALLSHVVVTLARFCMITHNIKSIWSSHSHELPVLSGWVFICVWKHKRNLLYCWLYDGLPKPLGGSTIDLSAFSLFGTQLETESLLGGRYLHICVVIEGLIDYQYEMQKLCDWLLEIRVLILVYFLDVT